MKIFLDCDGVLANFIDRAIEYHKFPATHDEIDCWDFWIKNYGLSNTDFWKALEGREFWTGIKPYPWAKELLEGLQDVADVTIVTSPCLDPECASAKTIWLKEHFGLTTKDLMIGSKKELLARNGLLIDDSEANVTKFIQAGGWAITFPQPWNNSPFKDYREVLGAVVEVC